MISKENLIQFRDAVADDVSSKYPTVDYVNAVVSNAIERHSDILGFKWMYDGPHKVEDENVN